MSIEGLTEKQKGHMAVAYLIRNKELQPDGVSQAFEQLMNHEKDAKSIDDQIKNAQKAIEELTSKFEYKLGAIEAAADMISTLIPADRIDEWAILYEEIMSKAQGQRTE